MLRHCNYVDDNTLSSCGKHLPSVIENLQTDVNNLINWFSNNKMIMNQNKSQVMLLSNIVQLPNNLNLNGIILNISESVDLLGIGIDRKLNFESHIAKLCKKLKTSYMLSNA